MSGRYPSPKVLKLIMSAALIGPIIVILFEPKLGAFLLFMGFAIAITTSRALSAASLQASREREAQLWRRCRERPHNLCSVG